MLTCCTQLRRGWKGHQTLNIQICSICGAVEVVESIFWSIYMVECVEGDKMDACRFALSASIVILFRRAYGWVVRVRKRVMSVAIWLCIFIYTRQSFVCVTLNCAMRAGREWNAEIRRGEPNKHCHAQTDLSQPETKQPHIIIPTTEIEVNRNLLYIQRMCAQNRIYDGSVPNHYGDDDDFRDLSCIQAGDCHGGERCWCSAGR